MRAQPELRRLRAERRLFEAHAALAVARELAGVLGAHLDAARRGAEEARRRALAAETPGAQRALEAARREVETAARALAGAREQLAELEAAQDVALDDLLVPLA